MGKNLVKLFLVTASLLSFCAISNAGDLYGTGDNFGDGGYRGTGSNFGRGWQSDGNGGYRGTGDNFGRGYQRR